MYRYVIFHNIIAPYKTLLFNELARRTGNGFLVAYLAETAGNRDWKVPKDEIAFPYEVLSAEREEDSNSLRMAVAAWRLLVRHDPGVVVVGGYNTLPYWAAVHWANRNRRKAVVIVESHFLDRPRTSLREAVKRLFVSRCDAALVDGTRHRDYIAGLGMGPEKIFIKYGTGPVDLSLYERESGIVRPGKREHCERLGLPERNFLYVGRFSPEKNILLLLEAYRRLREEDARWGLILVGDGPQREEILRFVADNHLSDVHLPGFRQKDELPFYYAISDLFVLPSRSEPWGLVAIEAMASGLPVLVSRNCGCYPDAVREGVNGHSFDPDSPDGLHSLMRAVVRGQIDLEAMGKASLEIVRDFTAEKAGEMYLRAFRFVLPEGEVTGFGGS